MSVYNCTPAIGLKSIYDKVEEGDIIEYQSKYSKSWSKAKVIKKKIDKVYDSEVYNIMVSTKQNGDILELRDLNDFHWRYEDLYDCNKYLLEGYKRKTKTVRLLDTNNVKKIYEHIESVNKEDAIIEVLRKYNFISKEDIIKNNIQLSMYGEDNKTKGKKYLRLLNKGELISEFWYSIHSVFLDDSALPKTWAVNLKRK